MKWTLNEPQFGDMIRVKIGNFYHYGIYVTDDEIIQFGPPPINLNRDASKIEVCVTNIEGFLCCNFLEVVELDKKEKKKANLPDKVVEFARSRIGEKGYHILYNNCEHFARECVFGERVCSQVEEVRNMWKNFPFVNVYIKKFPFDVKENKVFSKERQKEINSCGNEDVKKEKFYVWKLLEEGIYKSLNINAKDIKFKQQNNKWQCKECKFSLSHSNNVVAVVVARGDVGIDVEKVDLQRFSELPANRILTSDEMLNYDKNIEELNKVWTVKEAIFKKGNDSCYNPCKINTMKDKYITKTIVVDNEKYYLSVASNDLTFIKFNLGDGINLEK